MPQTPQETKPSRHNKPLKDVNFVEKDITMVFIGGTVMQTDLLREALPYLSQS